MWWLIGEGFPDRCSYIYICPPTQEQVDQISPMPGYAQRNQAMIYRCPSSKALFIDPGCGINIPFCKSSSMTGTLSSLKEVARSTRSSTGAPASSNSRYDLDFSVIRWYSRGRCHGPNAHRLVAAAERQAICHSRPDAGRTPATKRDVSRLRQTGPTLDYSSILCRASLPVIPTRMPNAAADVLTATIFA